MLKGLTPDRATEKVLVTTLLSLASGAEQLQRGKLE